jgi:hypothetical protein
MMKESSFASHRPFGKRKLPRHGRFRGAALASVLSVMMATVLVAGGGPSISVSVSPSTITNEGQDATYTLTLSSPATRRIAVNFIMLGTATLGSDYVLTGNFHSGRVMISPGQSSVSVMLHTFNDDVVVRQETAAFAILGGDRYRVGSPSQAIVAIDGVR